MDWLELLHGHVGVDFHEDFLVRIFGCGFSSRISGCGFFFEDFVMGCADFGVWIFFCGFLGLFPSNFSHGGLGSVRFSYGLGVERFERFRFSVAAVPLQKGFFCVSAQLDRKGRFRFWFLENGSGGSASAVGFGKNGSDGSGFRFRFSS